MVCFPSFLKSGMILQQSKKNRWLGWNEKGRTQVLTLSKPADLAHTIQAGVRISNSKHLGLTARK